jgi:predicted Zn-dependent protease
MSSDHKRNTDGLRAYAKRRSEEKAKKVDEVIRNLVKNKEKINFNSVAGEAGVTKAYLYNHPEFRERIEALRKQQEGLPTPRQLKREMTDASKDVVIASKSKRIRELEAENKRLKEQLQKLQGKLYDSIK